VLFICVFEFLFVFRFLISFIGWEIDTFKNLVPDEHVGFLSVECVYLFDDLISVPGREAKPSNKQSRMELLIAFLLWVVYTCI